MLTIDKPKDVFQHIGKELGPSEWLTVTQEMIDKFAEATGDHQWIHVDVERAKRELPGGKTIAHGYLTLSLLPRMAPTLMSITGRRRGVNYGSNKIRFISPVPAGSRIRSISSPARRAGSAPGKPRRGRTCIVPTRSATSAARSTRWPIVRPACCTRSAS